MRAFQSVSVRSYIYIGFHRCFANALFCVPQGSMFCFNQDSCNTRSELGARCLCPVSPSCCTRPALSLHLLPAVCAPSLRRPLPLQIQEQAILDELDVLEPTVRSGARLREGGNLSWFRRSHVPGLFSPAPTAPTRLPGAPPPRGKDLCRWRQWTQSSVQRLKRCSAMPLPLAIVRNLREAFSPTTRASPRFITPT